MVQEVVLGGTLKVSVFPLGDSGKTLEYLLKHPEFAENDKKRASGSDFLKSAWLAELVGQYALTSGAAI